MTGLTPQQIFWRSMLRPFSIRRSEHVYLQLFAKLALLAILYPLLDEFPVGNWIWTGVLWFMMLGAVNACTESRAERRLALVLIALAFVLRLADQILNPDPASGSAWTWLLVLASADYVAFFALVSRVVLRDVFARGRVTTNRILGAICFYVMLGIGYAYAFTILEGLTAEPMFAYGAATATHYHMLSQLLYFSFTSLTTLGFGDIVPRSDFARMLATSEAMAGQVYLTVLVARLVGLHIAQEAEPAIPADERR